MIFSKKYSQITNRSLFSRKQKTLSAFEIQKGYIIKI